MSNAVAVKDIVEALDALRASLSRYDSVIFMEEHTSYWEVPMEEQFAMESPKQLWVGDIADDIGFIGELILADTSPALFSGKLSSVLRYLATKELEYAG